MVRIASLALAAVLLAACGDDGGRSEADSLSSGGASRAEGAATAVPRSDGANAQAQPRKVILNSSVRMEAPRLRDAYFEAGRLVRSLGGFVAESSIDDTGRDSATANMRLRVPASRHDDLLEGLRAFGGGRILKESTSAREVTEEYTDLQSRLRNLQRTETQYQELLKQARTVDEILNVQSRLDSVRAQVEQAQGRSNLLDSLVEFATVSLAISVPGVPASEGIPGPREVFAESWDGAWVVARVLLNVGVVAMVAFAWLSIPALLVLLGVRFTARWRVKPVPPPAPE